MGEHRATRVYRCSDGRYYTDVQVWERLESGDWSVCCWDSVSMDEWVATRADELLHLRPVTEETLPSAVALRPTDVGPVVVESP